jgi:hypothetical protein
VNKAMKLWIAQRAGNRLAISETISFSHGAVLVVSDLRV